MCVQATHWELLLFWCTAGCVKIATTLCGLWGALQLALTCVFN